MNPFSMRGDPIHLYTHLIRYSREHEGAQLPLPRHGYWSLTIDEKARVVIGAAASVMSASKCLLSGDISSAFQTTLRLLRYCISRAYILSAYRSRLERIVVVINSCLASCLYYRSSCQADSTTPCCSSWLSSLRP